MADSLTEKPASGNEETGDRKREIYWLYAFQMRLTCALPDEQNTRGRKIHPPENAELSFGILVQVNIFKTHCLFEMILIFPPKKINFTILTENMMKK